MEIQLISGIFTIAEAEELLTAVFRTKIDFHANKIRTIHESEEDIKHSEKRILQLEETLRNTIRKLQQSGQTHTSLSAHIEVTTAGRLPQ